MFSDYDDDYSFDDDLEYGSNSETSETPQVKYLLSSTLVCVLSAAVCYIPNLLKIKLIENHA